MYAVSPGGFTVVASLHFRTRRFVFGLLRGRRTASSRRRQFTLDWLEPRQLLSLSTTGVPINPVAVEGTSFTSEVARFTDSDKNTDPTQYTVQINWGDGHVTSGTVAPDANPKNGFDVSGTHTYAEEGPYRATIQISDKDGDSATVKVTNIVADAALTATGTTLNASQNRVFNNVIVATFTDANPAGNPGDFTATIDWGDGITSVGRVERAGKGGTGFQVVGSHVYRAPGAFAVSSQIRDGGRDAVLTQFYTPVNLVSDGIVPADHTDPNLINPWGITASGGSPFWISDNGTGVSTIYDGAGNPNPLVVTIPGPKGSPSTFTAAPTGIVNNGNQSEFPVVPGGPSAAFIFATEDGTISAWNPGGPAGLNAASLEVDNSQQVYANGGVGAVYKGLALASNGGSDFLYAANFRSGNVDVFDSNFKPVTTGTGAFPGTFHDPSLPAGFAPFGIQALNGNLYVTFALQDSSKHDEVDGAGLGFVDVFSPAGVLLQKIGGTTPQPELNAPWGLVMAPANFGKFSNDLLVGNFGDSHVSAFDASGNFVGQLSDAQGNPLVLLGGFQGTDTKGLWGLRFGNGSGSGSTSTLYFTAGVNDETDGLLGSVTATSFSTASAPSIASVTPGGGHGPGGPNGGFPGLIPIDRMGGAEDFFIGRRPGANSGRH
jgi:uncharacterized protein (TIGR03118 family)